VYKKLPFRDQSEHTTKDKDSLLKFDPIMNRVQQLENNSDKNVRE
jgi:hypothetical protein